MSYAITRRRSANSDINKLYPEDQPIHGWYRFVLSFPPHLVREYLQRFGVDKSQLVLDPFCGTGTTLVECKKLGIASVGIEANPVACFASRVKVDWSPDPDGLFQHAKKVADAAATELEAEGIEDIPLLCNMPSSSSLSLRSLPPEMAKLLLKNSISPIPLHKTLVLLDCLKQYADNKYYTHETLALAKALVTSISNLRFGPEVGIGPEKSDAPVLAPWLGAVRDISEELQGVQRCASPPAEVHQADSRDIAGLIKPGSINAVITSPPYPNEKDYTRTTRLESVLLGFIRSKADLQGLKRGLLRSNTRNVYKGDDDDQWVSSYPEIQRLSDEIEAKRIALGKTSGFERLYATVTKLYFGGMARHLAMLRSVLCPGANLAYVVGDQASYLRVVIRTGQLLAKIAQSLGYEVVDIDLFRTRLATATREQIREEILVLRWPGA